MLMDSNAEVEVILDLLPNGDVALANRKDPVRPADASRSDARQVLAVAAWQLTNSFNFGRSIMPEHRVATTDAEIDAALKAAKRHEHDPRARSVEHIPALRLLIVELTNGRRLVLPIEEIQDLAIATHKQLQNYELLGSGNGISFPDLDVDLYMPALIERVYGNRRWMAQLGQKGGSSKSDAKRRASKTNGARGGRPKNGVSAVA